MNNLMHKNICYYENMLPVSYYMIGQFKSFSVKPGINFIMPGCLYLFHYACSYFVIISDVINVYHFNIYSLYYLTQIKINSLEIELRFKFHEYYSIELLIRDKMNNWT